MKCTIRWSSLQNKPLQRDIKLLKYARHCIISLCVCNHQYVTQKHLKNCIPTDNPQNWTFLKYMFLQRNRSQETRYNVADTKSSTIRCFREKILMFMPTESSYKSYADGDLSVGHTHRNVSNVMPVEAGSSLGQLEVAGGFEATRRSPD